MYKVFINDKVICFTNNIENCNNFSNGLVINFFIPSISPFLVRLLYNDEKIDNVFVQVNNFEEAFDEFKKQFKMIEAAGGIVSNDKEETLFIFRLNKWDLPKGKIEKNEETKDTALREIEEECGINDLSINKQLNDTFHIYKLKDQLILKQTYWFDMKSTYEGKLIPQLEEGITKVEWLTNIEVKEKVLNNTYASIRELIATSDYL